jgi:nucleotide-binding universal stress UspA family protein
MGALPRRSAAPRPDATSGIRRILLATDLSAASAAATSQALGLADDLRADLVILSVIEPVARLPGGLVRRVDQVRGAREAAAQEIVEQGRGRRVSVEFLVWQGEPAEAIVEAAGSEQVDLVVVGSRGRGSMGRLLIGSVSDRVVRHAPCPVLVVRARTSVRPVAAGRSQARPDARPVTSGRLARSMRRRPERQ